eukprot:6136124-Pyramimonas_sp.AAC.1
MAAYTRTSQCDVAVYDGSGASMIQGLAVYEGSGASMILGLAVYDGSGATGCLAASQGGNALRPTRPQKSVG